MELLVDTWQWLAEPARWQPTVRNGIPYRIGEHLWVSTVAMLIAAMASIPAAVMLAHYRRAEAWSSSVVNLGRAIPSFGLIVMFWLLASRSEISTQFWPLVAALIALAMPPMFTNSYTAIRSVDPEVLDAARGMGMTDAGIVRHIELPLAAPIIAVGIRLAYVQVIATTAIGAIVTDGGGLGRFIVGGFAQGRGGWPMVVAGAILLALVTLLVDRTLHFLEGRLVSAAGVGNTLAATEVATGAAG
ncbi:MAG: ABC transporter permease [Nitriliruptoraceae bacterium]